LSEAQEVRNEIKKLKTEPNSRINQIRIDFLQSLLDGDGCECENCR